MTHTTIEILSIGTSLAALFGAVIVVDWPLIRDWYYHLWDQERWVAEQNQAEYLACSMEMQEMHEAGHPWDSIPYDLRTVIHPEPQHIDDTQLWN